MILKKKLNINHITTLLLNSELLDEQNLDFLGNVHSNFLLQSLIKRLISEVKVI